MKLLKDFIYSDDIKYMEESCKLFQVDTEKNNDNYIKFHTSNIVLSINQVSKNSVSINLEIDLTDSCLINTFISRTLMCHDFEDIHNKLIDMVDIVVEFMKENYAYDYTTRRTSNKSVFKAYRANIDTISHCLDDIMLLSEIII